MKFNQLKSKEKATSSLSEEEEEENTSWVPGPDSNDLDGLAGAGGRL